MSTSSPSGPPSGGLSRYAEHFVEPEGYLDFARFGPPSADVVEFTHRLLGRAAHAGPETVDRLMEQELRARQAASRLLGLDPGRQGVLEHVALLPNASQGLFHAALGLAEGLVLVPEREFPANVYPWERSAALGRARAVPLRPDPEGRVTPDLVRAALTPEVVALSISAVDFRTGFRADLAALREVLGPDRLLVVDAIQGMGVADCAWTAADVVVTGGQKWLRAGWSTGFLYASDAALERLEPVLTGWTGVQDPGVFDELGLGGGAVHPVAEGAQRFSVTNLSPVTAGAFAQALELVLRAGVDRIAAHIAQRTAEIADTVRAAGGLVLSPEAPHERAGIVAFSLPSVEPAAVSASLRDHGLTLTSRPDHFRASAHASTTLGAVDRLLAALTAAR